MVYESAESLRILNRDKTETVLLTNPSGTVFLYWVMKKDLESFQVFREATNVNIDRLKTGVQ